jgi:hypothetical protein
MRLTTHAFRTARVFALVSVAILVVAGCSKKNNNEPTPDITEPPTASPAIQSAGDFQLGGNVDHAFAGVGPPVQVSLAGVSLSPSPGSGPTGTTGSTTAGSPNQQGVMRVTLDNVSSTLHDKCGVSSGDKVNVFWLTDTQFDASLLSGTTPEGSLEAHHVGVAGSIFVTSDQQQNLGLPTPTASPSATAGTLNTNCTLVADRVTSGEALPTVRPRATARRTARPTVRPTATASHTSTGKQ